MCLQACLTLCGIAYHSRTICDSQSSIIQLISWKVEIRYVAAHGLKHKEKTKSHSICMETKELSVFCYDCDEFVINDTAEK